jgi:hypothetical protein
MTTQARAEAKAIYERVNGLLRAEFGDRIALRGRHDDTNVRFSFEIKIGTPERQADALRRDFALLAPFFGLVDLDFDLPLTLHNGRPCKLVEVKGRSGKYPFVVQTEDGKRWKIGPETFLAARARQQNAA